MSDDKELTRRKIELEGKIMLQIMYATLSHHAIPSLISAAKEFRAYLEETDHAVSSETIGDALDDIMDIPQLSDYKEEVLDILYYTEKYRY